MMRATRLPRRGSPSLALLLLACGFTGCAATDPSGRDSGPTGAPSNPQPVDTAEGIVLAIHGGAGTINRESMGAEREAQYRAALTQALIAGHGVLMEGGEPAAAVVATIQIMEDSPLFNSGRGAVLTHDGSHALDASIMVGTHATIGVAAGAVAGVSNTRHPIALARAVMEHSPHVILSGSGADEFSMEQGLEQVPNSWFRTPGRARQLERAHARENGQAAAAGVPDQAFPFPYLGTVGCVARDKAGHLAAGTSTGGMTNKRWGRIGDSPIVGAGTWADDRTCAVSCTGHGEFYIRGAIAHDVHARMLYRGQDLPQASGAALAELTSRGGTGGWIALTPGGTVAAPFNTSGMYRGWIDAQGRVTIKIWH